jgi:hypothetical protein
MKSGRSVARAFAAMLLLWSVRASALDLQSVEISHDENTYVVSFDVVLEVPSAQARELLADFTQWPSLSSNILEAALIGPWLLKRELRHELLATATRLEQLLARPL